MRKERVFSSELKKNAAQLGSLGFSADEISNLLASFSSLTDRA